MKFLTTSISLQMFNPSQLHPIIKIIDPRKFISDIFDDSNIHGQTVMRLKSDITPAIGHISTCSALKSYLRNNIYPAQYDISVNRMYVYAKNESSELYVAQYFGQKLNDIVDVIPLGAKFVFHHVRFIKVEKIYKLINNIN